VAGDERAEQWSDERLRLLLDAAGVAVYDYDVDGGTFLSSTRLLELFGLPAVGPPSLAMVVDRVHPDDRELLERSILGALDPGGSGRHDVEFRVLSGDVVLWLQATGQTFGEGEGEARRVTRISGVLLDVTERRAAEESKREREALFEALFSSIDEGFCRCEIIVGDDGRPVDYRFLEVNALFGVMTGLTDAVGRTAYELIPNLEPHWVESYARAALGGETFRFEQGSEAMGRWFDVFVMPTEPAGQFVLLFKDVSEARRAEAALRESEARFRNMADNSPVMVWVTDADGASTYLSQSWHEFTGQSGEEALGFGWLDAVHHHDRARCEREFLAANERHEGFQVEYRLRRRDGTYRWAIDSAAPRFGSDGEFLGYIGSVLDITERKEVEEALRHREAAERNARQRVETVARMTNEIEAVAGLEARTQRFVDLLVPRFADWATLDLPGVSEPVLAMAHREPARVPALRSEWEELRRDGGPTPRSVRRVALDLGAGNRGVLLMGRDEGDEPSDGGGDDLELLDALAERAGLSLASARLLEQERHVALSLQHALLPDRIAQHPNLDVAARYQAASDTMEVGGDWYETFVLPDGRIGLAVGDVVGHGLEAAAVMGRLQAALAALAARTAGPGELLSELDHFASGPGGPSFATAGCAILDPRTGELRYATAGHPPLLVVSPSGATTWLDGGRSWPLCVSPIDHRPEGVTVLEPGAMVVLHSDGLIERRGEDLDAGAARLAAAVGRVRSAPVQVVCDRLVDEMADGWTYEDDVVVLALRFEPLAGAERFRRIVPAQPRQLATLRQALTDWLQERGIGETDRWDVVLAVGEASANAVEHAYRDGRVGEVDIDLLHDGADLLVRVTDHGTWRPPGSHSDDRGRGTAIMRSLSRDFVRTTGARGTTVTFCASVGS
jgi:PAS domain S-box-containing protein